MVCHRCTLVKAATNSFRGFSKLFTEWPSRNSVMTSIVIR